MGIMRVIVGMLCTHGKFPLRGSVLHLHQDFVAQFFTSSVEALNKREDCQSLLNAGISSFSKPDRLLHLQPCNPNMNPPCMFCPGNVQVSLFLLRPNYLFPFRVLQLKTRDPKP